ncbi:hypothetical protein LOTGIDRAFT_175060 [Lottia gigantea]|uniref:C-type lectin domain-containing protein n=1 Tax=Lottia gigantea TaxID=225164 RepID=V4AQD6_LOTGI|nr:hypothetical protein LOTGIDRAFT_175060 [Lottia gigantea]ESO95871.1 hypothetical protein LOTGIDRAFT_175060 [Lottia gigantea]
MTSLFLLVVFLVLQVVYSCPNGYHQHNGSCYAVVPIRTTWPNAVTYFRTSDNTYCKAIGGYLSVVDGAVERNYLKQYINSKYGSQFNYYWIGGLNYVDGSWVWSGSVRTIDHLMWNPGDPSGRPGEKCLMMVQKSDYLFSDFECDAKNAFVCETQDKRAQ